jgi:hypothetical protein
LDVDARAQVSTHTLSETVAALCALGEKVSGSDEEAKACAILVERLKSYGYQPVVHEFESYISYPRATALAVAAAGGTFEVPAVGVAFGTSTPPGGLRAEVVAVGTGAEAEYAGKDVAGKIVLVSKLPSPTNALAAAKAGAKGMICMSAGKQRHKMIVTPVWGTPEFDQAKAIPRVCVASISAVDGKRIEEALANGPVEATLVADVFEGWRKVRLPTVEIAGREPLFALVGAHYCSWFDGSTDNVTGDACVLELARVLKRYEGKLRYGLKFCWWPGHSHGRYSGSTWYADAHWHELYDHGIVYFNIDSPGVKGATVYVPRHQMAEVSAYNERMTKEITGWTTVTTGNAQLALGRRTDKYVSSTRPSRAADQSFWGVGLSSMSVYSMLKPDDADRDHNVGGSGGAWWWHSEHETIDKFDPEILAQDTRLYASILLGLTTADVLPFDLAAIAQDYLDSLKEFDEAAGDALPIAALMREVEVLQAKLAAFHARTRGVTDPKKTAAINRTILRIARTLNPVLYQTCSPFEHDPALGTRVLPLLDPASKLKTLEPGSDAYRFTVAGCLRRLNRVRHQVREAERMVDEASRLN